MMENDDCLLTTREMQVFVFIESFIEQSGFSPTHRQIAEHVMINNSDVKHYLSRLIGKKFIRKLAHMPGKTPLYEIIQEDSK